MNMERFNRSLKKLNEYTIEGKDTTRLAYSKEEKYAKEYIKRQLQHENMEVRMDEVGNIIAKREGQNPLLPPVAFGSHIDSVYEAGRYDGALGVIAALEIIRYLNEEDIVTTHPLEVIIFTGEESSRFGISTIGSRVMAGKLNLSEYAHLKDKFGITLTEALQSNSLSIKNSKKAAKSDGALHAFIEMHIEQGPVLEIENKDIGIVHAIAAPLRLSLKFSGEAGHSGTTPFKYRKDCLPAASEIVLEVENAAQQEEQHGTLATVGVLDVNPGAMNIVPGSAVMQIDIRSVSVESRDKVYKKIIKKIKEVEKKRELIIDTEVLTDETPVDLSEALTEEVENIATVNSYTFKHMNSGAGHDAMNMAYLCPTALIFVPSVKGISHNPEEFTKMEDIEKGLIVMKDLIVNTANDKLKI
jgi:hydantoinase/carbamoylase family amidase